MFMMLGPSLLDLSCGADCFCIAINIYGFERVLALKQDSPSIFQNISPVLKSGQLGLVALALNKNQ